MRLINRHRALANGGRRGLRGRGLVGPVLLALVPGPPPGDYDRFWEGDDRGGVVIVKAAVFLFSGSYNKWWRYMSLRDMRQALCGVLLASAAVTCLSFLYHPVADRGSRSGVLLLRPDPHADAGRRRAPAHPLADRAAPGRAAFVRAGERCWSWRGRRRRARPEMLKNPGCRLPRRSAWSTTTRARRTCGCTGSGCSAPPPIWSGILRERRARRGAHRHAGRGRRVRATAS